MSQSPDQNPKRVLLPPNVVAFFAGVVLAVSVGMIFRKISDKFELGKGNTALKARTQENSPSTDGETFDDSPLLNANDSPAENDKLKNKAGAKGGNSRTEKSRAGKSADAASPTAANVVNTVNIPEETANGEVDYLAWRRQLLAVQEQIAGQGLKNLNVTLTPRYRHQAKGLAITRGQFLDVVSKKVPANLPTRQANAGVILHALSDGDFDVAEFSRAAKDSAAVLDTLCPAAPSANKPIELEGIERVTILLTNSPQSFQCLQNWWASHPKLSQVPEISIIGFTRGSTFFGSLSAEKKLISLQMWHPDWLVDNTVGLDESGSETPQRKRALRLANVTRALAQPSDVRMQIPASNRTLAGPLIEPPPGETTPPKHLVVGNFALIPSHMPRGNLIATAFTNPGQFRSRSASVKPPGPGKTKAIVFATQGKKVQFMNIAKE